MVVSQVAKGLMKTSAVLGLALLAGGCSLLPFGLGGGGGKPSAKTERALRPDVHETVPTTESDCLAINDDEAALIDMAPSGFAEYVPSEQAKAPVTAPQAATPCAACACATAGGANAAATPKAEAAHPVVETKAVDAPAVAAAETARAVAVGLVQMQDCEAGEDALQKLMDGNKRFVEGESENVYNLAQRPGEASRGRSPSAMVLTCSDWTTLPEAAFDAPPGELYVVRVAGNVVDAAVIESAKYALERYDIPLIIVLGHEDCGAIAGNAGHAHENDAAPEARPAADSSRISDDAAHANVGEVVARLRQSDAPLRTRLGSGRLMVVGAFYDETNGQIELEPEAPAAAEQYVATPQD